ncbi:MAG: aminodeoxychorismate synthase component I [Burkholderiales bacterium]|nr:aminodeoxychorismate synthase component I [Burkholderiales bacterium]
MTAMPCSGGTTSAEAAAPANGPAAAPGTVVVRDESGRGWLVFGAPRRLLVARRLPEVLPLLAEVERAVSSDGLHAAGFVSYEAAPAFDDRLPALADPAFPLLWFGLYEAPRALPELPVPSAPPAPEAGWRASMTRDEYRARFEALREYIRNGDTYQVNFTYRLRGRALAEPWRLFCALAGGAAAPHAAYVDAGDWAVCSASPELFFRLEGETIESRPMKGTAARGLWPAEDRRRAAALRDSEKERAENVMIVDMVRNDLGRIALTGTVETPRLFSVERYPTLWQMTSTVRARTSAPLDGIFRALFPPASIVGAPRRRAMEIIAELETAPRRVYTGAIGYAAPGRRARFSVAIRTLLVERASARAEYGVGGGIVWDSDCAREWRESELKARVLFAGERPVFDLLETLLWTPGEGYTLMRHHLARLADSADYFGFDMSEPRVRGELERLARGFSRTPHRVRLLLGRDGTIRCEGHAVPGGDPFDDPVVAAAPVDRGDVFLYHKTTRRACYDMALRARPGARDVLLYNEAHEVTESTIANVAIEIEGELCTPPVECGLLAGTWRAWMLEEKRLKERVLPLAAVLASPRVYLMNAVRGMQRVRILNPGEGAEVVNSAEPAR